MGKMTEALKETDIISGDGRVAIRLPTWLVFLGAISVIGTVITNSYLLYDHQRIPAHWGAIENFNRIYARLERSEAAALKTQLIVGLAHKKEAAEVEEIFQGALGTIDRSQIR